MFSLSPARQQKTTVSFFFYFFTKCVCGWENKLELRKLLQRKGDKVFVSDKIASAFSKWEERGKVGKWNRKEKQKSKRIINPSLLHNVHCRDFQEWNYMLLIGNHLPSKVFGIC